MSAVLGYDTTLVHRALILKCEDRRRAQLAATQLRDALGASDVLLHPERVHGWALWLGRRDAPTRVQLSRFQRAVDALGLDGGAGEPQAELTGFRRSHVQAREALRVSDALAEEAGGVVLYADVRLEAMLLADDTRAREFVADELGPLAGDDERGARLRETVAAWLSTGSHVGAASLLDIHEHTVRNRLRQAEELCGTTLAARRTELAVALRLHRVLG
jgi:DNA-binding PucR family transcriptional regulator